MIKSNDPCWIITNVVDRYEKKILENYGKIIKHVGNFINNRSDALQSKNPGLRILYTPSVENDFYESCGIDKDEFKDICKLSSEVPKDYLVNDPNKQFYHLYFLIHAIACIFYRNNDYLIRKYYNNDENHTSPTKIIEVYFTIRMYSFQQLRIFHHVPNENIMEYTINNLNNRFELASAPNLFSIFERYTETNTESMEYDWLITTDKMMADYTNKMNNRIKMFLKKIFVEFMKNHDANLSSNTQQIEATNEEGKQFLLIADNISNTIEITSKKILNTFVQDQHVNEKLLKLACRNSGNVSLAKSKQVIQNIRDSKDEKLLNDMIMSILSYWLISMRQNVQTIHSKQFIVTCSAAYTISNTNDKYIIRLKETLEELIIKYTKNIIDTERKATIISFKKCIHIYMVLYIASIN